MHLSKGRNSTWSESYRSCEAASDSESITALPKTRCFHSGEEPTRIWDAIGATWLPEALSLLVALLTLISIVILLVVHQDKPLPNWPAVISVNSLVAIFTAILKAALAFSVTEVISDRKWTWFSGPRARVVSDMDDFDGASRGPWGAFKFLVRHPGDLVTSLGALVVVISLAIDPFAQQILRYYSCVTPAPGVAATVRRTNSYNLSGPHWAAGLYTLDSPMTLALYEGHLNPPANASVGIPFFCPTGNCTFPESRGTAYSSLAMCSRVEDVTSQIKKEDGNYTLPSGLRLNANTQGALTFMRTRTPGNYDPTSPLAVFSFEILGRPTTCAEEEAIDPDSDCIPPPPWAASAYLYPCVRAYGGGVNVSNSVLNEPVVRTAELTVTTSIKGELLFSLAGDYPPSSEVDCTPSKVRDANRTVMTLPDIKGQRYAPDDTPSESANRPDATTTANTADVLWYDSGCTYSFAWTSAYAISQYATNFFGDGRIVWAEFPDQIDNLQGPPWLLRLYGHDGTTAMSNVTAFARGLADAVTAAMRTNALGDGNLAAGTVLGIQTCIAVDWRWLALPVLTTALGLAFLVVATTSIAPRPGHGGGRRPPWKSSLLPLLCCGLPPDLRNAQHGELSSVRQMRRRGDEIHVVLHKETGGLADAQNGDESEPLHRSGAWTLTESMDETLFKSEQSHEGSKRALAGRLLAGPRRWFPFK